MFLPCRPCCGLTASCGGGCSIPNGITVVLTSQGLTSAVNWSISQAEIDTIEAFINGTYFLQYAGYESSPTLREVYEYEYPDPPYDYVSGTYSFMQFLFNCNTSSVLRINFCNTTSGSILRHASLVFTYSTTAPSVTQYCSGTSLSSTILFSMQFLPDTNCGSAAGPADRRASFQVSAAIS